jgi:hypothetical protein
MAFLNLFIYFFALGGNAINMIIGIGTYKIKFKKKKKLITGIGHLTVQDS